MSTFKKMMLLSQDEIERMKAKQIKEYDPSLHALARIQDQLDTVLNDPILAKIPPDERAKLLQRLQFRFAEVKHEGELPKLAGISTELPEPTITLAAQPAPVVQPANAAAAASPGLPHIAVNKRYRMQAERLIKQLAKDPNIFSVNDRDEIVVKGQAIPGSNVIDLFSDLFATSKSRIAGPRPPGFSDFVSVLKDINAPHSLLINPQYNKSLASLGASSTSFTSASTPVSHKKLKTSHASSSSSQKVLKMYNV